MSGERKSERTLEDLAGPTAVGSIPVSAPPLQAPARGAGSAAMGSMIGRAPSVRRAAP